MQLEFSWRDETTLCRELEAHTRLDVRLALTDNTSTLMSVKRGPGGALLTRLHRMFLSAAPEVVKALAGWLKNPRGRRANGPLSGFIRDHEHLVRSRPKRGRRLRTRGVHVDLQSLFDEVNAAHFAGAIASRITWGRQPGTRPSRRRRNAPRRSIRFGSYYAAEDLIRIHPGLDAKFVPQYFVRYIVFHEMLHAHLGAPKAAGPRRRVHPPEFKRIERSYPDYARAVAWQKKPENLRRLLGS